MVLLISGVKVDPSTTPIPSDSSTLYHMYPHLKESASQLASTLPKQVGPAGLLYVSQREFAACSPHDKNISLMGTDDCTTCLAVVLRHPASGAVAVGHFEANCVDGITQMLSRLSDLSLGYFDQGPVHMHLVGSFRDARGYSEDVIFSLLQYVNKESCEVELVTACVGASNTTIRGETPWPILYGVGVNVKTGEIFPATFPDKGPDLPLRHSRIFSGSPALLEIYDYTTGLLRIGPFHYEPLRCASIMLQESDEFILQHLTTSPEVEPAHIVNEIKNTLRHIQEHPFPEITIFMDNRPRYHRKEESGQWTLVRLAADYPFRYNNESLN